MVQIKQVDGKEVAEHNSREKVGFLLSMLGMNELDAIDLLEVCIGNSS